jgi:NADPH:quinone reductase-like Zn-dependent oxidoreductase
LRALTFSAYGGIDRLKYVTDAPEAEIRAPDEVRVRIHAAALNHLDLFVLAGVPGVTIAPGTPLGADGAGVVESLGSAVTSLTVGQRVLLNPGVSCRVCEYCREGEQPLCVRYGILGEHRAGTLAEFIVVPAVNVYPIPDVVTWGEGAAFPLATLTAWRMLYTRAQLRAGETILIWGIGGGVALAALQIAKRIGARAIVTSGSDDKLARARALGADETFNHRTQDVANEVRALTGKRGVEVVMDNVGAKTWERSLRAMGKRGRLVTCGGTSGPIVPSDVRRMFWNQLTLMGSTMGNDAEFAAMMRAMDEGTLKPVVDSEFALADARAGYERMASGEQFGKIVIRVQA